MDDLDLLEVGTLVNGMREDPILVWTAVLPFVLGRRRRRFGGRNDAGICRVRPASKQRRREEDRDMGEMGMTSGQSVSWESRR